MAVSHPHRVPGDLSRYPHALEDFHAVRRIKLPPLVFRPADHSPGQRMLGAHLERAASAGQNPPARGGPDNGGRNVLARKQARFGTIFASHYLVPVPASMPPENATLLSIRFLKPSV